MDTVWQDVRQALRMLRKNPGVALVAVLTLALGIGANAAIFNLVNAMLLRPFPATDPATVVRVNGKTSTSAGRRTTSYPDYVDYRDRNTVFAGLTAVSLVPVSMRQSEKMEQLLGEVVSGNYFTLLGVHVAYGRTLLPEDDRPGAERVVIVSHGLWQRFFGSDPRLLGRTIILNGDSYTVVGIARPEFTGTTAGLFSDLWVPVQQAEAWFGPGWLHDRKGAGLRLIGRLKNGVSVSQAQAAMNTLASQLELAYPESNRGIGVQVAPAMLLDGSLRKVVAGFLSIVLAVVGLVLLTMCANLANLLLVRAAGRRREMAIRLALGASRLRLVRQFLTEGIVLSLLGGAAGFFVGQVTSQLLLQFNPLPDSIPIRFDLNPDARIFMFSLILTIVTGVLLGLAPALQASRPELVPALKADSSLWGGGHKSRLRDAFVIAQVALSLVLLIGAGLFLRSLRNARGLELGFDPQNSLAMDIDLNPFGWADEKGEQYYQEMTRRVRELPGVRSASLANLAPLDLANPRIGVAIDGHESPSGKDPLQVSLNFVGTQYFETVRIPLVRGREFTDHDDLHSPGVVIIDEVMAKRFWTGEDPIGKHFQMARNPRTTSVDFPVEVIGVARNTKHRSLGEEPEPHMYAPYLQHYAADRTLLVRAEGNPAAMIAVVQRELTDQNRAVQGFFARTMLQHVGLYLLPARMAASLSAIFGLLVLLLAVLGIYGVTAYSVTQRTREIGIRMALGAGANDVLRLVAGQGLRLIFFGLAVGLAGSLGLSRFLASQLYGVSPTDPFTFIAIAVLLTGVALLASFIPARRATRVDPLIALRHE